MACVLVFVASCGGGAEPTFVGGTDAAPLVICGPGTASSDGGCSVQITFEGAPCPAGTQLLGGSCVPTASDAALVTCGPGTMLIGSICVPAIRDAASDTAFMCGPGTLVVGNACVPDGADADLGGAITCGPGTLLADSSCLPAAIDAGTSPTVTCGPGTLLVDGSCLADPALPDAHDASVGLACGPGTVIEDGLCVPLAPPDAGAHYEIRTGTTEFPADGYSKMPVFIIGTNENGTPSLASVIVAPSRADAGSLAPFTLALTPTGATTYFTPCNSAQNPGCLGPMNITLALAANVQQVVATSASLSLVAPTGVGSAAACMGGGNVLFLDGDSGDSIHPGPATIQQGQWSDTTYASTNIVIRVTPSDMSQGFDWALQFSTSALGQPLGVQVYGNAVRAAGAAPGHPGLDIYGNGRGCGTLTGAFQIEDLTVVNGGLTSFIATFEQHCDGVGPALRGCVRIAP